MVDCGVWLASKSGSMRKAGRQEERKPGLGTLGLGYVPAVANELVDDEECVPEDDEDDELDRHDEPNNPELDALPAPDELEASDEPDEPDEPDVPTAPSGSWARVIHAATASATGPTASGEVLL